MDIPAIERLLDEAFAAERFEAATSNVVYPALRAIGEDWAEGSIDVAMEHAASETIRRRLARFYDASVDLSTPLDVIVGMPPGCQHEIGAMGFAVAARRGGLSVLYLGANVPVPSWVRTADAVGAPAAVVGAIVDRDVPAATDVVTSLLASTNRPSSSSAAGWRRPSPRRPGRSRSRPSWTRPSTSFVSGCARAAPPDGPPDDRHGARRPDRAADGTLAPWRRHPGSIPSACRPGSGPRR